MHGGGGALFIIDGTTIKTNIIILLAEIIYF